MRLAHDWIQVHIEAQSIGPTAILDRYALEPPLHKRTYPITATVHPDSVADIQPLNGLTQIRLGRLYDLMIVVIELDMRVS